MTSTNPVPQWKLDQQLHTDYRRYAELLDHAGHAENEVDRAEFGRRANDIEQQWTAQAPQDWQIMRELHQGWQDDPNHAREMADAELRQWPAVFYRWSDLPAHVRHIGA
ncbi:hypothetical protein ACW9HQ_50985, partial [Nocardia gipuzkoensis]